MDFITHSKLAQNNDNTTSFVKKQQTINVENVLFEQNNSKKQRQVHNPYSQQKQAIDSFLKYGDIITLRLEVQDKSEYIIQGDGITLNKLEVVNINNQSNLKQDNQQFFSNFKIRECLFQIHPSKQYSLKNSNSKVNIQSKEKIFNPEIAKPEKQTRKVHPDTTNEDKNLAIENQNQLISNDTQQYPDETETNILNQLDSIVTFEQDIQLVHLYSGSKIKINKDALATKTACKQVILNVEDDLNSNFQILSQANRKKGEPVFYGEKIYIATKQSPWYYLNINQMQDGNIELVGSLNSYPFNFNKYLDYQSYLITLQENNIQSGNIISIKNISSNSYLSCKKIEDNQGNNQSEQSLNQQLTSTQNQYQITLDKVQDQENEIASFWQIEYIKDIIYAKLNSQIQFTLKHALTGLYLSVVENGQNNLSLGLQISKENQNCTFRFLNQNFENTTINKGDLLSIVHEKEVKKDQKVNFILQSFGNDSLKIEQTDSILDCGRSLFVYEIKEQPDLYSITTLNSILFKSYYILNEFQKQQNYPKKKIDDSVDQINQIFDQIYNFLNQSKNVWQDREKKQISLVQTNIFSLAIQILMCLQLQIPQVEDCQNERLMKCKQKFFSVIMEIVRSNVFLCNYILQQGIHNKSAFFQLFEFFDDCDDMHHIIQHIILFGNNIPKKVIKRLIDKLNKITEQNIDSQINLIKLLSLIMADQFENPRVDCQIIILNSMLNEKQKALQFHKFFFKFEQNENLLYFDFFPEFFQDQSAQKNQKFFDQLKIFNSDNNINSQGNVISLQFLISDKEKGIQKYLDFFVEVLLFYSNLCKGRNYRAIEIIKKLCNIEEDLLFEAIKFCFTKEITKPKEANIFSALFQLYVAMFLNIDPLVERSHFVNQNFYYISNGQETVNINQFYLSKNEQQDEDFIENKQQKFGDGYEEISNSNASPILFSQKKLIQQKERKNKISLQLLPIADSLKQWSHSQGLENPHTYVNILNSLQNLSLLCLSFDQFKILLNIFSETLDSDKVGRMPSEQIKLDVYKKINFKSIRLLNQILDIFVVFMVEDFFETDLVDQTMLDYLVNSKKHPYCYLVIKNFYIKNYHCLPKNFKNQISFEEANAWNEAIQFFNGESVKHNLSLEAIKYEIPYIIQFVSKNKIRKEKFQRAFNNVNQFIVNTIEHLQQQNLEKKSQYQNAFLKMGGFKIFNPIIIHNDEITQNQEISEFYANLLKFYFQLTKNHAENSLQIQNINQIIILVSYIEMNFSFNLNPKRTRISKLLKNFKFTPHCQLQLIKYLFVKMEIYGGQILSKDQFYFSIAQAEQLEFLQTKNQITEKNLFSIQTFIEYLKILIVLVDSFELNQNFYIERKELILSLLLRNTLVMIALQPKYYFNSNRNGNCEFIYENQSFFRIKLHKNLIMLISSCCKFNMVASQEFLRIISLEKVKELFSTTAIPYKLKTAYLNYMFVLQFKQLQNKTKEDLENEISDFLKIFQFEFNKFAENLQQGSLIQDLVENKQPINLVQKDNLISIPLKDILNNNREYWKYILKNCVTKLFFEFLILHRKGIELGSQSLTKIIELLQQQQQENLANKLKQQRKVEKFLQNLIFLKKIIIGEWTRMNHFKVKEKRLNFLYKQQLFETKINYGDFKKQFLKFYLSQSKCFIQMEIKNEEKDLRDRVESQSTQEYVVIQYQSLLYKLEWLQEMLKFNHNSFWTFHNNRMLNYKINLPSLELLKCPLKVFLNLHPSDLESLNLAFSYFNNKKIACQNFQQEFELILSNNLQNIRKLFIILYSVFSNYFQFNEDYKINQQLFWENSSKFIQKLCRNNINFQNLLGSDDILNFQYGGNFLGMYLDKFCNFLDIGDVSSDQIYIGFNTILSLVSRCELNSLKICQNSRFMFLLEKENIKYKYENQIEKLIFSLVNLSNGQKNALIMENYINISRINYNYSIVK